MPYIKKNDGSWPVLTDIESGWHTKKWKYDQETGLLHNSKTGRTTKTISNGYLQISIPLGNKKYKKVYAHRYIYSTYIGNIPEGMEVDHIDGDRMNNKLSNLRLVTRSQNNCNRKVQNRTKSGVKGLREKWISNHYYWECSISIDGKYQYKTFKDKECAIDWLNNKRDELHGEYAHM